MFLVAIKEQKNSENFEFYRAALLAKANQLDYFEFKCRRQRDFYDFKTQTCAESTQKNGVAKDRDNVSTFAFLESELRNNITQR